MNNVGLYKLLEGTVIKDQYHLQKLIGTGGFGAVFHAEERFFGELIREVAVKVISPLEDRKKQQQQLAELKAAINFDHPYLLKCHTAGEFEFQQSKFLYLVMELAEYSLEQFLKKNSLSPSQVRRISRQVAKGLDYLHREQQQVHRDLKPGNVLWVRKSWVICDFGLVRKLTDKTYTATSSAMGTLAYMPPEAFDGTISYGWDIWSLGILVATIFNEGKPPYKFKRDNELMKKVMTGAVQLPELPPDLQQIVEGCLNTERKERWSAKQVRDALWKDSLRTDPGQDSPLDLPPGNWSEFQFEIVTVNEQGQIKQRRSGKAKQLVEDLGHGTVLEMVAIPKGDFLMGTPQTELGSRPYEQPQHRVEIAPFLMEKYGFLMGKYPITQAQYLAIMGQNPSDFRGENNPVENVSWNDAVAFCKRLSETTGKLYRLPSEAEWEYACRGGTTSPFYFGEIITPDLVNYYHQSKGQHPTPVGSFYPNAFGLYDLHGLVFEWCEDVWHRNYQRAPKDGSAWLSGGDHDKRVLRGGSWVTYREDCRSGFRRQNQAGYTGLNMGFRVVCSSV